MQGGAAPILLAKHGAIIAHIVNGSLGIPKDRTLYGRLLVADDLLGFLLVTPRILRMTGFHRAFHILANIERPG